MTRTKSTFCRICEPNCPLVAHFDDQGAITELTPDLGHVSGGVACHKGLSFLDVHRDPDRLDFPLRRANPKQEERGDFARTSWTDAIDEIAERTRAIQKTHGKNAVAVYLGNPFAFNAAALLMAGQFQDALDTAMRFSAFTQDTSSKFAAIAAIYGSADSIMIPDIQHTDYLLCLGSNPKVSRWTAMSQPNNWETVKDIGRRGGKVSFVNPRRTESSAEDTGPTILIKPGTDIYFLAAVLDEIASITDFAHEAVARYGKNLDGLRAFVANYPADRVSDVTGVPATVISEVARDLISAKSAVVYAATGINQSRQGILCAWLVEMINFVTGNLGKRGGSYKSSGLADHFSPVSGHRDVETSIGSFTLPDPIGFAVLPGVLLHELIAAGDIKALFTLGGNPLLSVGGGEGAREAYAKLDLLVSLDIYRSATGEISDFILPTTDWLERPDINLIGLGNQPYPYVQYSDAMVEQRVERRNDWWVLARLAQAIGAPSPLDDNPEDRHGLDGIEGLLSMQNLSVAKLREMPANTALLPPADPASLYDRCLVHPDGKIDCMPQSFVDEGLIDRCAAIFGEFENEAAETLRMISLRTPYLHNSWLNNADRYRKGKNAENPLHMTEADASERGLVAGDRVRVWSAFGEVETRLLIDDDLCRGAVALSHGYGQDRSFGMRVAQKNAGANCNALMPVGTGSFEPLSYMSWLSGVPVQVERV